MPLDVCTLINDRFFDERSSTSTNKGYSVLQADEIAHLGVDILLHNQIGPDGNDSSNLYQKYQPPWGVRVGTSALKDDAILRYCCIVTTWHCTAPGDDLDNIFDSPRYWLPYLQSLLAQDWTLLLLQNEAIKHHLDIVPLALGEVNIPAQYRRIVNNRE